jgi:hypothetical protein
MAVGGFSQSGVMGIDQTVSIDPDIGVRENPRASKTRASRMTNSFRGADAGPPQSALPVPSDSKLIAATHSVKRFECPVSGDTTCESESVRIGK